MPLNAASEKKLEKVKPELAELCRRAGEICKRDFQIVQGNRTQAEQNALYAKGRTTRGPIVTWTKNSKHIGGNAIDFAALVNGKISWNDKLYPDIANAFKAAAKELGESITWGGDWKTKDFGHIQLEPRPATPRNPAGGVGWTIADVQQALLKHGFDPDGVDGILGRKTRAALTAFQKATGLPQTGAPDKATTDALARKPAPPSSVAALAALPAEAAPAKGSPAWAVSYLESLGWSHVSALALTAHLIWESGGKNKINWSAHGDNNHSHGAGQWNDRAGRFQALEKYAADHGLPWDDPSAQIQFLDHELRSTESKAAKRLKAANTREEAVQAALSYWRPSIPHLDKRQAVASKLEKELSYDEPVG